MVNFTVIRRSNLPVVQLEEDSGSNFFQHIPEEYIPGNYVVQHSLLKGAIYVYIHYEKKLTKNIKPTDILQIYTSI